MVDTPDVPTIVRCKPSDPRVQYSTYYAKIYDSLSAQPDPAKRIAQANSLFR